MKQCEFVLSPVYMPNRFIIGDLVAYEGIKLSGRDGYEATHGETSPEGVNDQVRQFDRFFANSRRDMIATHPPDGRLVMQLESFYKEAVKLWKRV